MPNISVVIATYNRAQSLKETLESLIRQSMAPDFFEGIVVDNNSKDDTRAVVEKIARVSPFKIRYAFEPRQGISYARNTGIKISESPVIAFTDDDVVLGPLWLQSLWDCFSETNAVAVGGRIERLWNCERPTWYRDEIGGALIYQNLGPERTLWKWQKRHMIGANMAFRREVFEKFGYFCEELGRKGDSLVGGEDREMFQRIFCSGAPLYYEPKAVAYHRVEKSRLSKDFMRRWFWHIGETLGHSLDRRWYHVLTFAPVWSWKIFIQSLARFVLSVFKRTSRESEMFCSEMWVRHHAAFLKEAFLHWLPFRLGKNSCAFVDR